MAPGLKTPDWRGAGAQTAGRSARRSPAAASSDAHLSLPRSVVVVSSSLSGSTAGSPLVIQKMLREGKWQRGRLLGRGQFGSVHLALLPTGQALAVKQLDASELDEEESDTQMREIEMMRTLQHPNIVSTFSRRLTRRTS